MTGAVTNNLKAERTLTAEELQEIIDESQEQSLFGGNRTTMVLSASKVAALASMAIQSLSTQRPMGEVERGACLPVIYCGLSPSTYVPVGSCEYHCDLCGHPAKPIMHRQTIPKVVTENMVERALERWFLGEDITDCTEEMHEEWQRDMRSTLEYALQPNQKSGE